MKTVKIFCTVFALGLFFDSCSDTKECKCDVEVPSKALIQKAQSTITFDDWDTDCSKITNEDLEDGQFLINPCEES